jgi:hypothetical protein
MLASFRFSSVKKRRLRKPIADRSGSSISNNGFAKRLRESHFAFAVSRLSQIGAREEAL